MGHPSASRPRSGIASVKYGFFILDEYEFSGEYEDKLILRLVPVSMRRPRSRWQFLQMNPELSQVGLVTEGQHGMRTLVSPVSRLMEPALRCH